MFWHNQSSWCARLPCFLPLHLYILITASFILRFPLPVIRWCPAFVPARVGSLPSLLCVPTSTSDWKVSFLKLPLFSHHPSNGGNHFLPFARIMNLNFCLDIQNSPYLPLCPLCLLQLTFWTYGCFNHWYKQPQIKVSKTEMASPRKHNNKRSPLCWPCKGFLLLFLLPDDSTSHTAFLERNWSIWEGVWWV